MSSLIKESWLTRQRSANRTVFILIALSVIMQMYPVFFTQPVRFMLRISVSNILIIVSLSGIYRCLAGKLFALIVVGFLTLNFSIAFCSWQVYQGPFNIVFAMSILTTQWQEVKNMSGMYIFYLPIVLAYFIITFYTIHYTAKHISKKSQITFSILLLLFIIWFSFDACKKVREDNLGGYFPAKARFIVNTPFYVLSDFIIARRDNQFAGQVNNFKIDPATFTTTETGIETYIIVIGESARRSNMSVYGFGQDTTPVAKSLKPQSLFFKQAIAPASGTIISVPIILSRASAENFTAATFSDNIINLANAAGYDTHWYSAQGLSGKYNNYISAIASGSHHSEWIPNTYDDELLPYLDKALRNKGKKLIVLHINGSHEISCTHFPASAAIINTGNKYEDCYNNSILFTDTLLGNIVKRVKTESASLLYFSDHGLEKNPGLRALYVHGSETASKEAYDVPQFIWYSASALASQPRKIGEIDEPYSTGNNYELILTWLGISTGDTLCHSPLSSCYHPQTSIPVTDGGRYKIYEYKDLRENFSSPKRDIPYRTMTPNPL